VGWFRPGKPIKTVMIYSSHSLRCPGGLSSRRLYRFGIIWNLTNREIFKHNSTSFYLLQLFLGSVLSEFCFMFLAFMAQAHFLYVRWQNGHKRTLFFCLNLGQTTMVRVYFYGEFCEPFDGPTDRATDRPDVIKIIYWHI